MHDRPLHVARQADGTVAMLSAEAARAHKQANRVRYVADTIKGLKGGLEAWPEHIKQVWRVIRSKDQGDGLGELRG
eukprot:6849691-Alexandrium_andersonii.AAC.1